VSRSCVCCSPRLLPRRLDQDILGLSGGNWAKTLLSTSVRSDSVSFSTRISSFFYQNFFIHFIIHLNHFIIHLSPFSSTPNSDQYSSDVEGVFIKGSSLKYSRRSAEPGVSGITVSSGYAFCFLTGGCSVDAGVSCNGCFYNNQQGRSTVSFLIVYALIGKCVSSPGVQGISPIIMFPRRIS